MTALEQMKQEVGLGDNETIVELYRLQKIFSLMETYKIAYYKQDNVEIKRDSKELEQMKTDEKIEVERTKQSAIRN